MRSPLTSVREHAVELARARSGSLASCQGALLLHVAVEPAHALPDLVQRVRQLGAVDQRRHRARAGRRSRRASAGVELAGGRQRRRGSAATIAIVRLARLPSSLASSVS